MYYLRYLSYLLIFAIYNNQATEKYNEITIQSSNESTEKTHKKSNLREKISLAFLSSFCAGLCHYGAECSWSNMKMMFKASSDLNEQWLIPKLKEQMPDFDPTISYNDAVISYSPEKIQQINDLIATILKTEKSPGSSFIDPAISNNLPLLFVFRIASLALAGCSLYYIATIIYDWYSKRNQQKISSQKNLIACQL